MNAKKNLLFLCSALLLLVTPVLTSCRLGRATPTPIAINLPGRSTAATDQVTYTVQKGEVVQQSLLSGRVIPARQEDLFFRRSGQVTQVYVKDGDRVESGDLIAALDNEVLELDLESALLGLAIAKENLDRAEKDLLYRRRQAEFNLRVAEVYLQTATTGDPVGRDSSVSESGLLQIRRLQANLAQLVLDNLDETVDPTLALNIKRAELAVERVKQAILEGQIVAPFAGEIRFIKLPVDDEQLAAPAYSAVARLVDTTKFRIELNLPREQLETLAEGMPVAISAASLGTQSIPGVIEALPRPFGTSQGSLTEVAVNNANDNDRLREGITVGVTIRLKSRPNALVLPLNALEQVGGLYQVMVQRGNALERIEVAVGVVNSDLAEITGGLREGDVVVQANVK